jgi:hypothetical protein
MNKNINKPLLIFIILTLFLVSCSSKPSNTIASAPVEETLSNFFRYLKNGDLNSASKYLDKSKEDYNSSLKFQSSFQEEIIKKVFSKIEYRIISSSCKESTAKVNLEITSVDFLSIYNDVMSKSLSPLIDRYLNGSAKDKADAKNEAKKIASSSITNILNSSNFPKTTNKVKLTLSEVNGKWLIEPNEDFIFALTGRMPQLLRQAKNNK